jgi:hypothetical protein
MPSFSLIRSQAGVMVNKRLVFVRTVEVTLLAVFVPVLVNVLTGGSRPRWLAVLGGWEWLAVFLCVPLVIALEQWAQRSRGVLSVRRPGSRRNVTLAVARVERYLELRRQGDLVERGRMPLAMDDCPAAVRAPAHLVQRIPGGPLTLSSAIDVFDEMSESVLILGAAGSGKTTQLLDLATALVTRTRLGGGIPVVLDLGNWSPSGRGPLGLPLPAPRTFSGWLLGELQRRYHIPTPVGRVWLDEDRLILLFDGLDEVDEAHRDQCVAEINALQQQAGITRVAVCCRSEDYHRLDIKLDLQGAVVIRPLTRDQVVTFLQELSPTFADVAQALRDDTELWDLLTSPLMLSIMTVAYADRHDDVAADGDRRRLLFDSYLVEVLARRKPHKRFGDTGRVLRSMRTLARSSDRSGRGEQVLPLNPETFEDAGDVAVRVVRRRWLTYGGLAACGLVAGGTLAVSTQGWAAVIAGFLLTWYFLTLYWTRPLTGDGTPHPVTLRKVLFSAAWIAVAAVSALLPIVAIQRLLLPLADQTGLVAAAFTVLAAGFLGTCWWLFTRLVDNSSIIGYVWAVVLGLMTAVPVLLIGVSGQAISGWTVGFVSIVCSFTYAFDALGANSPQPTAPAVVWQDGVIVVAVLVCPLVTAASWSGSPVLPLLGFVVGIVWGVNARDGVCRAGGQADHGAGAGHDRRAVSVAPRIPAVRRGPRGACSDRR